MAFIQELRQNFFSDLVAYGVERPPQPMLQNWVGKFRAPLGLKENLDRPRLANQFFMGCGAELLFWHGGAVFDSKAFRLGRCGFIQTVHEGGVRIQIPKHKSCLQLVAGIAKSMQCIAQLLQGHEITAVSSKPGFSTLGPVYFGRLGANRQQEVAALDAVCRTLLQLKVFDEAKNVLRQNGDKLFRRRGLPGDVVRHSFGYEYRSFPSFLDSPLQALLTLTLAKLAVLSAAEVTNWLYVERNAEAKVLNLLAKFKGLDDDARLVHWLVSKYGFPRENGALLKNWGAVAVKPMDLNGHFPIELPIENDWLQRVVRLCRQEKVESLWLEPFWKQTSTEGSFYTHLDNRIAKLLWDLKCKTVRVSRSETEEFVVYGFEVTPAAKIRIERTLGCSLRVRSHGARQLFLPDRLLESGTQRKVLREILCREFSFCHVTARESRELKVKQQIESRKVLYPISTKEG